MKVLIVHNRYRQSGGEDAVVTREARLLRQAGHSVVEYRRSNEEARDQSSWQRLALLTRAVWSSEIVRDLRRLISRERPDVAHFHNTFAMVSPSAYFACREMGIPVVQSLHNSRLICPAATSYRNGRACTDCLGKVVPWPGMIHGCYKGSRISTAAVASVVTVHRWLGTWSKRIDLYIAFTDFYRRRFVEHGLPSDRVVVKPHFVHPDPGPRHREPGEYALFVGRLDPEKGIRTVVRAWQRLRQIPLIVRGDGRLLPEMTELVMTPGMANVKIVGRLSEDRLMAMAKGARFLLWPSEGYYETFGLVTIEAFACGVPVIASGLGAMAEIVQNGRTGLHFRPGDADDLAAKVEWAWTHPREMVEMGREARQEYEVKYTAERNYHMLMDIYDMAIAKARH